MKRNKRLVRYPYYNFYNSPWYWGTGYDNAPTDVSDMTNTDTPDMGDTGISDGGFDGGSFDGGSFDGGGCDGGGM